MHLPFQSPAALSYKWVYLKDEDTNLDEAVYPAKEIPITTGGDDNDAIDPLTAQGNYPVAFRVRAQPWHVCCTSRPALDTRGMHAPVQVKSFSLALLLHKVCTHPLAVLCLPAGADLRRAVWLPAQQPMRRGHLPRGRGWRCACLAYRVLQQCRHAVATSVLDLVQFSPGLPTAAEALTLLRLHLQ